MLILPFAIGSYLHYLPYTSVDLKLENKEVANQMLLNQCRKKNLLHSSDIFLFVNKNFFWKNLVQIILFILIFIL